MSLARNLGATSTARRSGARRAATRCTAGRRGGGHGRVRDGVLRDELKEALAYRDADKVRWGSPTRPSTRSDCSRSTSRSSREAARIAETSRTHRERPTDESPAVAEDPYERRGGRRRRGCCARATSAARDPDRGEAVQDRLRGEQVLRGGQVRRGRRQLGDGRAKRDGEAAGRTTSARTNWTRTFEPPRCVPRRRSAA